MHNLRMTILGPPTSLILAFTLGGCAGREKSQADRYLPPSNEAVTMYGMTLDEQAAPEQTVWALLMAVRDDVRSKMHSPEWDEAMRRQCRLTDVELLREVWAATKDVDQAVFEIILSLAPALNFYAEYFDEEFDAARTRMTLRATQDASLPRGKQALHMVNYVLDPDGPDPPPGLERGVTIQVLLSKTEQGYWRVYRVLLGPPAGMQQDKESSS